MTRKPENQNPAREPSSIGNTASQLSIRQLINGHSDKSERVLAPVWIKSVPLNTILPKMDPETNVYVSAKTISSITMDATAEVFELNSDEIYFCHYPSV